MEMNEMIARINALAKKKKSGLPLTEEELAERKILYADYLSVIRGQVISHLDNIEIVEENPFKPGEFKTVKEAKNFPKTESE